jgi:hypothetical protein
MPPHCARSRASRGKAALFAVVLAALAFGGVARAEPDLFSRDTVFGLVDLRAAAGEGETSWIDGGFGKTRFGGDGDGGWRGHAAMADAILLWKPRFSWDVSAVVDAEVQPGPDYRADLGEAYLVYRPVPHSDWRFSGRLGYFYPPVSLEHDGPGWTLTRTITPSAINSWIGEEVKVIGAEASIEHELSGQQLALTGAVFGYNDTAGTLLTYRGWALDDVRATAFIDYPLPALSAFAASVQPSETYPTREADGRAGYYLRADWRTPGPVAFNALYYDNGGDKVSVTSSGQWAWATRFANLGMSVDLDARTQLLSQLMSGRTLMGFPTNDGLWFDVDFDAAYLLLTHSFGADALTGRLDWFRTRDRSMVAVDNNDEHGWAATAAWRHDLSRHARLMLEALHVDSDRPSRLYGGVMPKQAQTTLQSSLRLTF